MLPTSNLRRFTTLALLVCSILVVSASPVAKREVPNTEGFVAENNNKKCHDLCKDVVPVNSSYYLCHDARLGPKELPTHFPLDDITHPYDRLGGLCAAEFLSKWTIKGSYTYPPKDGFQLDINANPIEGRMTLVVGMLLDRFGSEYGAYLSPAEAPYPQRALPPSNLDTPPDNKQYPYNYHVYKVVNEFVVSAGPIAPWFGQPGQGVQYHTDISIMNLISGGYLERVSLKHSKLF
ncbi:hypothetical protein EDD21DRAFT_384312 [Dissophora ornata]|nr:hypothetical protein BGZ58_008069 [Dissophora ornata]KAI8597841.1 hypothetical protein EDD21DRAFT_384312 [Dissophora ornata]